MWQSDDRWQWSGSIHGTFWADTLYIRKPDVEWWNLDAGWWNQGVEVGPSGNQKIRKFFKSVLMKKVGCQMVEPRCRMVEPRGGSQTIRKSKNPEVP
jgi:hypothetical protein